MATIRSQLRKSGVIVHDKEFIRMLKAIKRRGKNFQPAFMTALVPIMKVETDWIFNSGGGLFNWAELGNKHGRPKTKRHKPSGLSMMRYRERGQANPKPLVDTGALRGSFHMMKAGRKKAAWGTNHPKAPELDQLPGVMAGRWYALLPMVHFQTVSKRSGAQAGTSTQKWMPARPFGYISSRTVDKVAKTMLGYVMAPAFGVGGIKVRTSIMR